MSDLMFNSVKRITDASPEDREMMREAIRGEFEAGKYLRDMGTGAAAGAAGGAIAGAGVGSLPGAAVGAIGGAVFGLGSNAVSDIAYQIYGDEGKAAWQAGDIEDHLNKMGGWINGKIQDQHIGQLLSGLGASYKNYIDVAVNKASGDDQLKLYKENIFNPSSASFAEFQQQLSQQAPQVQQQRLSNVSKFLRLAYEDSSAGLIGGTGATLVGDKVIRNINTPTPPVTPPVVPTVPVSTVPQSELLRRFWTGTLNEADRLRVNEWFAKNPDAYKKTMEIMSDPIRYQQTQQLYTNQAAHVVDDVAQAAASKSSALNAVGQQAIDATGKLKPSSILNTAWKGVKGLGAGLVVDIAANWTLDKIDMMMTGGEIKMFRRELGEVQKVITEINRLTNNNKDIVYAGNILWTNLQAIDRDLQKVEAKKDTENQPAEEPVAQTEAPATPRQNAASIKFVRLK